MMKVLIVGASGFIGYRLFKSMQDHLDFSIQGTYFNNNRSNGFVYLDDGISPYSNCKPTRRVGNEFSGDIGGKLFHIHFNCNGIKNPINGDPGVRYNDRLSDPCSSWDVGKIAITTQNSWPDIWTGIACCSAEGEARIYNIDQR